MKIFVVALLAIGVFLVFIGSRYMSKYQALNLIIHGYQGGRAAADEEDPSQLKVRGILAISVGSVLVILFMPSYLFVFCSS